MAHSTRSGAKIQIDGNLIRQVDETLPYGQSRTSWINYLVHLGLAHASVNTHKEQAS